MGHYHCRSGEPHHRHHLEREMSIVCESDYASLALASDPIITAGRVAAAFREPGLHRLVLMAPLKPAYTSSSPKADHVNDYIDN